MGRAVLIPHMRENRVVTYHCLVYERKIYFEDHLLSYLLRSVAIWVRFWTNECR